MRCSGEINLSCARKCSKGSGPKTDPTRTGISSTPSADAQFAVQLAAYTQSFFLLLWVSSDDPQDLSTRRSKVRQPARCILRKPLGVFLVIAASPSEELR